ncbi:DUF4411 family protein [Anaerocolumna sp. AGMB13025]|uniref:DUF4411 family protein n=1 Tax=Anaerocolumna sp. AGMB13025 TaxID=3039116 RepID=UPI002420165C|nr:DUF4411 family protein [Anaerocolumna sp. AGMB13025]WFR57623.1 DUF4411 family protein [Anaerocolumna sp. AGMB13025]
MITYVVDNNIFSRSFRNIPLDVFDDIWEPWSKCMKNGKIISVDEAYCEMEKRWGPDTEEGKWLKEHKGYFLKPTNEEGFYIREIFKSKKFREGIKESSLRNGTPEADAILVAKAKVINGIVVTAESDEKPNSEKIPNIAVSLNVPYMNISNFYKLLKNIYKSKNEYEEVYICKDLCEPILLNEYLGNLRERA